MRPDPQRLAVMDQAGVTCLAELRAGMPADRPVGPAPIIGSRETGLPIDFVAQLVVGEIGLADWR
ncbi:hypothetical protein LBMAG38_03200 [Chloroflexota bacterium]|nr:hypothetical protein LBMAG38_03200 [Chloroflexota bacterium]